MNKCALELDMQRNIVSGSPETLRDAIKKGANLRVYTEFRHNEHIDTSSDNNQMIREVSDFPATYLIDDRWVSGIMTLRQPVTLPDRFGERASMSFFMYNEDGTQACARPYLDAKGYYEVEGSAPCEMFNGGKDGEPMEHMHMGKSFDEGTNAPSINFVYDFYSYKFLVQDEWTEVLSHDENGNVLSGSAKALDEASSAGCNIKVAISGICEGLWGETNLHKHELFIECGPHYYYDENNFMICETRPFVRVKPSIPMTYESHNWDFGWAIVRSDGHVSGLFYDPYTLKIRRTYSQKAMRWFVRNK
ncbi:MAG: hypothetical protein II998_08465 [Clostridia bacterium]|nr:hypothetical protein [Clostridia bacterium]